MQPMNDPDYDWANQRASKPAADKPAQPPPAKRPNYVTLCIRPELRPKIRRLQVHHHRRSIVSLIEFLVEAELERCGLS